MRKSSRILISLSMLMGAVSTIACASVVEEPTNAARQNTVEQSAAPTAIRAPNLSDLSFLTGRWRGGDDAFIFEEIWTDARGGVMTGMARGVRGDELSVLEYIVIEQSGPEVTMRFKHFNADYSVWASDEAVPVTLALSSARPNDATFVAVDTDAEVQSIRYFINDESQLQADISLFEKGEPSGFSLTFFRVQD